MMTTEPFDDDTRNPFMPGDDLPIPNEGDTLILRRMKVNEEMQDRVTVLYTHDTLAESWDPVGEAAWQQRDVNDDVGFKGHWYAIVEDKFGDEWSVASYEVAAIEKP
jgi:hypothetical protein